jgi:4-amino-4-deoxy-L-arabinose transferase-like glycosyltransferase
VLLALVTAILRTAPSSDFAVSHVVNFLAYGAALVAFDYLLRGITARVSKETQTAGEAEVEWIVLGYALFLWAALGLIGLGVNTPDMLLGAAAFAVAGILVRIPLPGHDWSLGVGLGVTAALGYLSKAAFFPLSVLITFPVAAYLWWRSKKRILPALLALVGFVIACAPHVIALSQAKHRFSFGESGRIAYAWTVNAVPGQVHWQGGSTRAGVPTHPTRQISVKPDAFEFATPLDATYPPWYDPSYWYEGVKVHADPIAQLRIAYYNIPLLVELLGPLILIVFAIIMAARGVWQLRPGELERGWPLVILGVAAVAMYATIFLESRYVAPFIVMLWFGALLVLEPLLLAPWRRGLFFGATVVLLLGTLPALTPSLGALSPTHRNAHGEEATFLLSSGLRPGDRVAVIGDGIFAYWARLARLRIVGEVPSRSTLDFWSGSPETRHGILEAFQRAGAVAVIADYVPSGIEGDGWRRQANGRLSVLPLAAARTE